MRIKHLAPNPKNPRTVTDAKLAQLRKALHEFGDISGIVFNRETGNLVGGHQRTKHFNENSVITISRKYAQPTRTGTVAEGYVELDGERFAYREVQWDRHREMAANIAANKGAGEWNLPELTEWLKELNSFDVNFDLDLTMFDTADFGAIGIDLTPGIEGHTGITGVDEDAVPEKPPARTKSGYLYQLGEHRLLCGDSTDGMTVSSFMAGEKVDLVLTDPPYGVSYVGKTQDAMTIQNDKLAGEELLSFLVEAFTAWPLKPGGSFYVFSPAGLTEGVFRQAIGEELRQCMVWVKQQFVMGRQDYHWRHESILYGWRKGGPHYFIDDRTLDTVWEFDRPRRNGEHPTMKPIDLLERGLLNSSKPDALVFDGFGGSGSTLIACEKTRRKCRMMELDPHYCDVIVARWEQYTGLKAKLVAPVKTKVRKSLANREATGNAEI